MDEAYLEWNCFISINNYNLIQVYHSFLESKKMSHENTYIV